jgi:hypothetical protein
LRFPCLSPSPSLFSSFTGLRESRHHGNGSSIVEQAAQQRTHCVLDSQSAMHFARVLAATLGPMSDTEKSTSEVVKAGFSRVCADFTKLAAPFGFARTNSRSREWNRQASGFIEAIYFHRSGSSYGAPRNNSIDIRVHFSIKDVSGAAAHPEQQTSDRVRDERGYAYHLRFNALTWSTYDRCLEDLLRVTRDHGLPWFKKHKAQQQPQE